MTKLITKLKTPVIIFFGVGLLTAVSGFLFFIGRNNQANKKQLPPKLVYQIQRAGKIDNLNTKSIRGAIIPHHDIAEFFGAHLFSQLSEKVNHVILIGPNHQNISNKNFVVNSKEINTSFGPLYPSQWVTELDSYDWIKSDSEIIAREHAITNFVDYIKYFLPQAKLTALMLKRYPNENHLNQLKEMLINQVNNQTIVVGSVDFSHYLTPDEAENKDQITSQMIKKMEINGWFNLDETYLDSPAGVYLLITTMKATDNQPQLIRQSNSAQILNEFTLNTTSYQYWIFN